MQLYDKQPPGVVICRTTSADLAGVDAGVSGDGNDRHWPAAAAADPLCPTSSRTGCDHKNQHNSWKTSPSSPGCTRCLRKTVASRTSGSRLFRKIRLPCFVFLSTTTIVLIVTLLIIFVSPSTFFTEKSKALDSQESFSFKLYVFEIIKASYNCRNEQQY